MMRRCVLCALPVLALATLLLLPDTSFAQRRGGGGRRGGTYVNVGGYGGYGYGGYGYGGYGYGYPYYGGSGIGVYGRNFGVTVGGGYPYYGASPYYGGYGYSSGYYSDPYYAYSSGPTYGDATTTSQAFYPQGQQQQQQPNMTLGRIHVRVPPSAEVMFDGNPTQQKGMDRMFETPSLDTNRSYSYEITASWTDQNGQQRNEKRTVNPMPGRTVLVDFMQPQREQIQGQPRPDNKTRPEIRQEDR